MDEYCDEQMLPVNDRVPVSQGVRSGAIRHRNVIVHRDANPGNILSSPTNGLPEAAAISALQRCCTRDALTRSLTMTAAGEADDAGICQPGADSRPGPIHDAERRLLARRNSLRVAQRSAASYDQRHGSQPTAAQQICDDRPRRPSTVIERPVRDSRGRYEHPRRDAYAVQRAAPVDPRRLADGWRAISTRWCHGGVAGPRPRGCVWSSGFRKTCGDIWRGCR